MNSDLETDITVSARAGYTALEVWAAKLDKHLTNHSLGDLKFLFTKSKVEPTAINSIEFIGFCNKDFKKIQNRCRQLCAIAESINCSTIVVVPSPTPRASGDSVLELFYPWEKVVDEYVSVLRNLSEIAAFHSINLAFEFVGFAWCSVRTPRGAFEIIQKVNCNNVGMNFDCCHFYGGGGELTEIEMLDPSRILTFHLNDMEDIPKEAMTDSHRLLPGLGIIPLAEICERMSKIGYDGVCAIELFRPEYWQRDPYELAVRAREAAIKVLSSYFEIK